MSLLIGAERAAQYELHPLWQEADPQAFLAAQGDLGRKQHPRFVRVAGQMPRTATFKVLTRVLAAERWNAGDPVWWRPDVRAPVFVPLGPRQAAALDTGIRAGR